MEFDLIAPHMDKGWSFTIFSEPPVQIPAETRETLFSLLNTPMAKRARPFVQSDCLGWIMIEFWTNNEQTIAEVASFLENGLSAN